MIDEIRARAEAATPGPWYWDAIDAHKCICLESKRWTVMDFVRYGMNGAAPRFLVNGIMERADTLLKSIPGKEHHRGFDNYIDHHDAAFIAHAREDIPYLLSEVDRLTSRAEKAEAERDKAVEDMANYVQGKAEVCAYCINDDMCEPGEMMCVGFGRKAFEWRGLQEEEGGEG